MRLCLLEALQAIPVKVPPHDCPSELNKSTNQHVKEDRVKTMRPLPYTQNHRQLRKAGSR